MPPSQVTFPKHIRILVFCAALVPLITTVAYMMLKPAPERLKRNFPPNHLRVESTTQPPNTTPAPPHQP